MVAVSHVARPSWRTGADRDRSQVRWERINVSRKAKLLGKTGKEARDILARRKFVFLELVLEVDRNRKSSDRVIHSRHGLGHSVVLRLRRCGSAERHRGLKGDHDRPQDTFVDPDGDAVRACTAVPLVVWGLVLAWLIGRQPGHFLSRLPFLSLMLVCTAILLITVPALLKMFMESAVLAGRLFRSGRYIYATILVVVCLSFALIIVLFFAHGLLPLPSLRFLR